MPVSEATYRQLAVEDREGAWELVCGKLRQKPGMTMEHNSVGRELAFALYSVLPGEVYSVDYDSARLRLPDGTHYIPDVVVIPRAAQAGHRGEAGVEAYPEFMPLVVEVWSPSTGDYDARTKLAGYRQRGDAEIGPSTRALALLRPPCGNRTEATSRPCITAAPSPVASLPGVVVDMDCVFRLAHL